MFNVNNKTIITESMKHEMSLASGIGGGGFGPPPRTATNCYHQINPML